MDSKSDERNRAARGGPNDDASSERGGVARRGRRRGTLSERPAVGPTGTLVVEHEAEHAEPGQVGGGSTRHQPGGLPHMPALRAAPATAVAPARSSRAWRWVWLAVGVCAAGLCAAVLGVYFTLEHYAKGLPSVEKLKAGYDPPQITRILARDGTLLASVFTERRTVIPFEQVPDSAKLAFLAAEDAAFYEHEGLNYWGMLRALYANIRAGHSIQGGSSITQQVVKNVLLDSERTYRRKIRESILALRLEQSLSKDEIFWLYLNHIYLGHGRYGIEEAARHYFGKHARELSLDEAAILAGLVAAPERYSPRRDVEKSLVRRRYVLDQMKRKGFVTEQLYEEVNARPVRLSPNDESESRLAPEIVDRVKAELEQLLGDKSAGGYTVHTTIDPDLQAAARRAARENLDAFMTRHKLVAPFTAKQRKAWPEPFAGTPKLHRIYTGVVTATDDRTGSVDVRVGDVVGRVNLAVEQRYNPERLPPSKFTEPGALLRVGLSEEANGDTPAALRLELGPQSVLLALDVRTRAVVALVGSYEALSGGLDRATRARRQPGSAIKPLVFSYALHSRKFTAASLLPTYKALPNASERDGRHWASLRQALAHSDNAAAVYLLEQSGPSAVVQWARDFGLATAMQPDQSFALGAYEVVPIELANAYAVFASGGVYAPPRYIARVEAPDGSTLSLPGAPDERTLQTPEEAYLTTSLLQSVVEVGTGQAARRLGRAVAGKTGTTNDSKDAWFVGYSPELVALVWVGYDDALPLGKSESGSKTALPAWINFMEAAHKVLPKTPFARPASVLSVRVDPTTGLLPRPDQSDAISEEFLPGTEPSEVAPEPVVLSDAGVPPAATTGSVQP